MNVSRPLERLRSRLGIVGILAAGIGIWGCSASTSPLDEMQTPDATSDAPEEDAFTAPSDAPEEDASTAPSDGPEEDAFTAPSDAPGVSEDATMGTPPESGAPADGMTPSDAMDDRTMAAPPPDGSVPDAGPGDAGPDADGGPITEGGSDAQPDVEASPVAEGGPDAQPESDAGQDAGTAAGSDASDDGGTDGGPPTPDTDSIIQTILGDACYECATTNGCVDEGIDCEDVAGTATDGPAVGTSRDLLCVQALTCILQSGCAVAGSLDCYCGAVSFRDCEVAPGAGACTTIEESSVESTEPTTVLDDYFDTTGDNGGGMANYIANCMSQSCPTECFGQ